MTTRHDEILKVLRQFSKEELVSIFNAAMEQAAPAKADKFACPYCSGSKVILYGKKHSKQRFFCKDCQHTFVSTTKQRNGAFPMNTSASAPPYSAKAQPLSNLLTGLSLQEKSLHPCLKAISRTAHCS